MICVDVDGPRINIGQVQIPDEAAADLAKFTAMCLANDGHIKVGGPEVQQ